MTTVQDRIKALGLTKVSKSGGRRATKKRTKATLEQRVHAMVQEGKPVPKHLAKKFDTNKLKEMMKNIQMPESVTADVVDDQPNELPTFENQEAVSDEDLPEWDVDRVPNLIPRVEDITDEEIVIL